MNKENFERTMNLAKELSKTTINGIESGFTWLDSLTNGFDKGQFVSIAGRPSTLKTTFIINVIIHIISNNQKVLLFSLEMPKKFIIERILAILSDNSIQNIHHYNDCEFERLYSNFSNKFEKLIIDDTPFMDIDEIEKRIIEIKPDVVAIDYLGLIKYRNEPTSRDNIQDVCKKLNLIAKQTNTVIIIDKILGRQINYRADKHPIMMQDAPEDSLYADVALYLHREQIYHEGEWINCGPSPLKEDLVEIDVAKNANGQAGYLLYRFNKANLKMEEVHEYED